MKQACSTTVSVCGREYDGLDTKACEPYVPKKIRFHRSEAGAAALARRRIFKLTPAATSLRPTFDLAAGLTCFFLVNLQLNFLVTMLAKFLV